MKYYQVYCVSIHGSDVLEYDDLEQAKKQALEWSKKVGNDCYVSVHEIIDTCVFKCLMGEEL